MALFAGGSRAGRGERLAGGGEWVGRVTLRLVLREIAHRDQQTTTGLRGITRRAGGGRAAGHDVRVESGCGKRKRTVRKSVEPASNGEAAARNKRKRTDVARESNAIKRPRCLARGEPRGENIREK